MIFNPKDQKDFQSATICHICEQDLNINKETGQILKVRDHCHFTGEYRGAAHNQCNLNCLNFCLSHQYKWPGSRSI